MSFRSVFIYSQLLHASSMFCILKDRSIMCPIRPPRVYGIFQETYFKLLHHFNKNIQSLFTPQSFAYVEVRKKLRVKKKLKKQA